MKYFTPLFKNYIKKKMSQIDCLNFLEEYWSEYPEYAKCVTQIFKYFYDEEVISEENILEWWNSPSHDLTVRKHVIRENIFPFFLLTFYLIKFYNFRLNLSSSGYRKPKKKQIRIKFLNTICNLEILKEIQDVTHLFFVYCHR